MENHPLNLNAPMMLFVREPLRLDELVLWCRITVIDRGVEQSAAREAHNLKVAGSSPAPAILSKLPVLKHSLEMILPRQARRKFL